MNQLDRPDYHSAAYEQMRKYWQPVIDVLDGTIGIREKHEYLPRFPKEPDDDYNYRVSTGVKFPATEKTLDGLVGLIFRRPPQLGADVPAAMQIDLENCDLMGSHWQVFSKELLREAISGGTSIILVDKSQPAETRRAELGARPYFAMYRVNQVINWRETLIDNARTLEQITFEEITQEPSGQYGEEQVVRYRTFMLTPDIDEEGNGSGKLIVRWQLKRKIEGDKDEDTQFILEAEGSLDARIDRIPLGIIIGGERKGLIESRSKLTELALLEICHYQKRTDYDLALHINNIPILWTAGRKESTAIQVIGHSVMIDVDQGGQVNYAEPTGASIGALQINLEDLKAEAAAIGISFLLEKPQPEATATASIIDEAHEASDLATIARRLKDGLETALNFWAQYEGFETGGTVDIGDVAALMISVDEIRLYREMYENDEIDLDTLWSILIRAGKLPHDFDREQVRKQLTRERLDDVIKKVQELQMSKKKARTLLGESEEEVTADMAVAAEEDNIPTTEL